MPLSTLLNRPLTLIRRGIGTTSDAFGNEIPAEIAVEVLGELQQTRRDEPAAAGETSDTKWMLFLHAGVALDTGDGVVCDGQLFEVTGDPWNVRNPRTALESHVEATLRRVGSADDEAAS